MFRRTCIAVLVVGLAVIAVGCGDDDEPAGDSGTTTAPSGQEASCEAGNLPTKEDGKLQVATGEPAFEPWVFDDDPSNGKGFESAVTYAVAEELGIEKGDVSWTRTGFDEAIAPGAKDYDFNIQQFGITPERDEAVDFSDGYYTVEQAIVGRPDGPIADATSLEDLKGARLGAAISSTSLDYIEEYIQPDSEALVYDDNAAAKASFDANQVDGIVFDLPTAYFITSSEIPDSEIIGVLPQQGETEELGLLFETDSPLIPCVNEAIATLKDNGTLADLEEQWLSQGGDIPTLEK
jgi:polar amino acid transport system substrate-binding protein